MRKVIIALVLCVAGVVTAVVMADVWDGDRIQNEVNRAANHWLTPEEIEARKVALVEGLPWPARRVGQTVARTMSGNEIKIFVQVPGN